MKRFEGRAALVTGGGTGIGRATAGVPEDVAGAIALYASTDAAWVTGSVLEVDGEFTSK